MYHYSEDFLSGLDVSNLEIANQLLSIFNEAFLGFENSTLNQEQLFIRFCKWDKDTVKLGSSVLFSFEPNFIKFYETSTLEIQELEPLVSRIIRQCDLSFNERSSIQDDLRLTIEKYALQDFITVCTKEFINQNSSVVENISYQVVTDPQDAQLYINGLAVQTVNGVYNSQGKAGTVISVKVEAQGYCTLTDTFTLGKETSKTYTLEPQYIKVHFAVVPDDAEVKLYRVHGEVEGAQPLSDLPSGVIDTLEEVSLNKVQDMYCQSLRMYQKFILYTKKRLYKPSTFSFTALEDLHKVITLEDYKVHVVINLEETAHVSLNGKSIDIFPYEFDCMVGEFIKIEAFTDSGLRYSNFIIANEADIPKGLNINISFTKTYHLSVSLTQEAELFINGEMVGNFYEGDFIENSVVDIKVEKDGYLAISDRIVMTRDIEKVYTLTELLPRYPVVIAVNPSDAFLTINGKAVTSPWVSEVYEGSSLEVRASKDGYYAFNEKILINSKVNKILDLTPLPILDVTLKITCNVEGATCYVNDQLYTLPGELKVQVGSRLKVQVFKDGYTSFETEVQVNGNQELKVQLQELQDPSTCTLNLYVDRINALVMINGKQVNPESIHQYKVEVPKDTICYLQVTLPGFSPYYERFTVTEDLSKRVYLEKDPELEMYRLSVYLKPLGAVLKVNDVIESVPFVRDYRSRTPINIKCYRDGYRTFEQNLIMTKNYLIPVILEEV